MPSCGTCAVCNPKYCLKNANNICAYELPDSYIIHKRLRYWHTLKYFVTFPSAMPLAIAIGGSDEVIWQNLKVQIYSISNYEQVILLSGKLTAWHRNQFIRITSVRVEKVLCMHHITQKYVHYITSYITSQRSCTSQHITSHQITLHNITLHYISLRCVTLHHVSLRYVTLRYVTLRYFKLRMVTLHYITLHNKRLFYYIR